MRSKHTEFAAFKKVMSFVFKDSFASFPLFLYFLRIPGEGGRDSEIIPVSIPKLIRSRFRDEAGQ
jgi:hypothetical protein